MTNILFAQMLCSRRFSSAASRRKTQKNGKDFMEMGGHASDAPRRGGLLLAVRIISFDHIVFIEVS